MYFVILRIILCFATAYSRNSRWKMFIYLICNTISNKTTAIFTFCLALNNKIVWIYTITDNLVSSSNATLPMSKEVDIVVFLKSDNNESHVPSKKTTVLCIFVYKVSFKKSWGGKKGVFSCESIPQRDKMFVGKIFAILNAQKLLMWSIEKIDFRENVFRKVLLMCFK